MKKSIILTVLLMALLVGCGQGVKAPNKDITPVESLKAKDFFSFEKDVFMDFKGTGNEYAEYKTYVDYVKDDIVQIRNMNPGTVSVSVYQYKDGELIKTYSRGETYYLYDYTNLKDKEEVIIKEPIKEGTSWSVGESSTRSITGVNKEIDIPLGKYNALEITTENNDSIIKDYYVKGIGKVKSEFVSKEDKSNPIISELQNLEKNATNKQDINFYFPDFNNDRITRSTRTIDLSTNQDIMRILEDGLKTAPEGKSFKGTLTANVKILDIIIDDEKGVVTVDFSPELVTEMNAGTTYEMMILNSIANTFGDYFQKDKIIITMEGKPYSSGHILMREGEYIEVSKDKVK
jgi:hypothetical protein